jgi:hypothetical protein
MRAHLGRMAALTQANLRAKSLRTLREQLSIGEHHEAGGDPVLRKRETNVGAYPGGLARAYEDDG